MNEDGMMFMPMSMPPVGHLLNSYRQQAAYFTNQMGNSVTPITTALTSQPNNWQPDQPEMSQEEKDYSDWLNTQPVATQQHQRYNEDVSQRIIDNVFKDPAMGEIGEAYIQTIQKLGGMVKEGAMTQEEALNYIAEMGPTIEDTLNRHKSKEGHSLLDDPELHFKPKAKAGEMTNGLL